MDWSAELGWNLGIDLDPTGASDIYWYTDNALNNGIMSGDTITVSMTVPSYTTTVYDYVLEDVPITNWGYDCFINSGLTWLGSDSAPVPAGSVAETPEPASMIALCSGCMALILFRRKQVCR